ncbi:dnaJ homolog subfamily C member 17 [Tetranychus urticae]|uniref:dnaJ homolog subfamily C member 17 n=1 Tax=Tetranychus urticae TaxID=32264 RepID=UPI00077BC528|nr:dnaJ homolog subfamily C member 17 [Tetranychus urticae]
MDSMDYYEFLEISSASSTSQIKKAYRKKALILHPDKNLENPHAKADFEKLSKILDILTDPAAREKYDRQLRAQKEKKMRDAELDAKRKKLRDELEERERLAKEEKERKIMEDIARMKDAEKTRIANLRQLDRENQKLKIKVEHDLRDIAHRVGPSDEILYRLRVEWASKFDVSSAILSNIFSKFGPVNVIMSPKSSNAEIEFKDKEQVMKVLNERFDNLSVKKLTIIIQTLPKQSPYGPSFNQALDSFENEVLSKLRLAQLIKMGQPPPPPPLIC